MSNRYENLREHLAHAGRQSVPDWTLAYAAGAALVWVLLYLFGQYYGWPAPMARNIAIAFAIGLVPAIVISWNRDFDYDPRHTRRVLRGFTGGAVVAALALWFLAPTVFTPSLERILQTTQEAVAGQASIAVRPFRLSGDPAGAGPIADGIHEDLTQRLRSIPTLSLLPHGSVDDLPVDATPGEVAETSRARFVVSGELAREGDRIRLSVTLTEGIRAAVLWSKDYERPISGLLALEAEIAEQVASSVVKQVEPSELARLRRNPTENPAAYEAFLQGQHHLRNATPDSRTAAINEFRQAIMLDPNYARAWAGLADAYNFRADLYLPQEVWPVSSALAQRAVMLDPTLPEVQATSARILAFYEWKLEEAEVALRRVMNQGVRCGDETRVCESYFFVLFIMGRCDDAITVTAQLVAARPRDAASFRRRAIALACAGRYAEAIDVLERSVPLVPKNSKLARASHLAIMAYMNAFAGRSLRANQLAREAVALGPQEPIVLCNAGIAFGVTGDKAGSIAVLELFERVSEQGLIAPRTYRAAVLAGAGRLDEALTLLEAALANREVALLQVLNDPGFDKLRGEPRFKRLVERMGGTRYARSTRNM